MSAQSVDVLAVIRAGGVTYEVIRSRKFEHNGDKREFLTLRRSNGTRLYCATRYGNGSISEGV